MRTVDDYKQALVQLLPRGRLWDSLGREDTNFDRLMTAMAEELARVDGRGDDLLRERDPRTTVELLEKWEELAGLPDPCVDSPQTDDERRKAVHARLVRPLGLYEDFYIELAKTLGYTISIERRWMRLYGKAVYGDPYGDSQWRFVWVVVVEAAGPVESLECLFERVKPAHTVVKFEYTG